MLTVWIVLLWSGLALGQTIQKTIPESKPSGYVIHRFPSPSSGEYYFLDKAYYMQSLKLANILFKASDAGVVTSAKPFEYRIGESNTFTLTIVKRQRSQVFGGTATTLLVTIKDSNNFLPTFGSSVYNGTVMEGSKEDTVVKGLENCHAEDRDTGGISSYTIISGNEKGYFKTSTINVGEERFLQILTTDLPITRDTTNTIKLVVEARDSGSPARTVTTQIHISVENRNENTPKFEKEEYTAMVMEETQLNSPVARVHAKDTDQGMSGSVYYYLSPLSSYFTVNPITGVVILVGTLDYQKQSSYQLTVMATDRGSPRREAATKVILTIKDSQFSPPADSADPGANTAPVFTRKALATTVREDLPKNGFVFLATATDNDPPGPNQRLLYSLSGPEAGLFAIDPDSAVVTLAAALDYEKGPTVINLTVTATDQGSPALSASAPLIVYIKDVDENQNLPVFDPKAQAISVKEDTALGTSIFTAKATDEDSGPDGELEYSMVAGEGVGYVILNETTGVVTTAAMFDRKTNPVVEVVIAAHDKGTFPRTSKFYLLIQVEKVDDMYPEFTQPAYSATVLDGSPENTFVVALHATDYENTQIEYRLVNVGVNDLFQVERSTGVIRTAREPAKTRGDQEFNQLIIEASDKTRQAITLVNILIKSTKEVVPRFTTSAFEIKVPENSGPFDSLVCLAATDGDLGSITYSITGGGNGKFAVDQHSGKFSVLRSFDYELENGYIVQVQAETPNAKTSSANVKLIISNIDDLPSFAKPEYTLTVPEGTTPGTTILDGSSGFQFVDDDTNPEQFGCSLMEVTSMFVLEHFRVERSDSECRLTVIKSLFEHHSVTQFTFLVQVTNKAFPNIQATAKASYWATVSSDTPTRTPIVTVTASDLDKEEGNQQVLFQFVSDADSSGQNRFQIDSSTGTITSTNLLAANNEYKLTVKATDTGSPPMESQVSVTVSVITPITTPVKFAEANYAKTIQESLVIGNSVLQVTATGPAAITYSIVGGNKNDAFRIDRTTGQIAVNKPLDYEVLQSYVLNVRATCETYTPKIAAEVAVAITLTDVNDNSPVFLLYSNPTTVTVNSYTPEQTVVFKARRFTYYVIYEKALAVDADSESFGTVRYSINSASSNPSSDLPFSLDASSGQMKTTRVIKYSDRAEYTVALVATDGGGKSTTTSLVIKVFNINEPPKFPQPKYEFSVPENKQVGTEIGAITATYADPNTLLKYSITRGNIDDTFCVNSKGVISLAKALDSETKASFTLDAMVSHGTSNHTTVVQITVNDINDNWPIMEPVYNVEVREDQAPGTELVKVVATDLDGGVGGTITYTIIQTQDIGSSSLFAVNASTGVITLVQKLDAEDINKHVLYVKAEDGGPTPKYAAITKVVVLVGDVNDHAPRFSSSQYLASVPYEFPVNFHVFQVIATDADSGSNAELTYAITGGNEDGIFKINSENGLVSLARPLASSAKIKHKLSLKATDNGVPRRIGTSTIIVFVILADLLPKFPVSPLIVNVKEGVLPGGRVTTVKMTSSRLMTYRILEGNDEGYFRMDSLSGDLLALKELDYEDVRTFTMRIKGQDTDGNADVVTLVVNLEDVNDCSPVFAGEVGGEVMLRVEEPFLVAGVPVVKLDVYDKDAGDRLTFELSDEGERIFTIDDEGQLIPTRSVNDITEPLSFTVTVRDSASPPHVTSSRVTLNFEKLGEALPVESRVREDAYIGMIVTFVPKVFPKSVFKITYPKDPAFSIDEIGDIRVAKPLDFEKQVSYTLTVREAESIGSSPRVFDRVVVISVIDVNDNVPRFTGITRIYKRINKNSLNGSPVLSLNALDLDYERNGEVGFQIVPRDGPFGINPVDEMIETTGNLNKESYEFDVYAFDYGIPRLNSTTIPMVVHVAEVPPIFEVLDNDHNMYRFETAETSHGGELIGTVKAVSYSKALIAYEITSGNVRNSFKIGTLTGEIRHNNFMNYEIHENVYNLTVTASELIPRGHQTEIPVIIHLKNINDNYPRFTKSLFTTAVNEDVPVGTSILQVTATDCDCSKSCLCAPGELTYSIDNTDMFAISPDTGVISPAVSLDYEMSSWVVLVVKVEDKGGSPNIMQSYANITLLPVNDNSPVFAQSNYAFQISETAEVGNELAFVTATDRDGDPITYTIEGDSGPYIIDPSSGIITLSREAPVNVWEYNFKVKATDGIFTATTDVLLDIIDQNNHKPQFTNCGESSRTVKEIAENLPSGQVLMQVQATDEDRGLNGEVEYELVIGFTDFSIDNTTGVIKTRYPLDRERTSKQYIVVRAKDGGHRRNELFRNINYCLIIVSVVDANDNYPLFHIHRYVSSVYQKAPVGHSLVRVKAIDLDTGSNAKVEYTFVEPSDKFAIEKTTGIVTVKTDLSSFTGFVTLQVQSSNPVPITVSVGEDDRDRQTLVVIDVTTVEPPMFERHLYNISVRENAAVGTTIGQIRAVSQNNRPIMYQPLHENPNAKEEIGIEIDTGSIVTSSKLDYESVNNYELQFVAVETSTDKSETLLFSTCFVNVTVIDVNDHTPTFNMETYECRIFENSPVGTGIIRVHAEDLDTGRVTYSLHPSRDYQKFTIDTQRGTIRNAVVFDREEESRYSLTAIATDAGSPPFSTQVFVKIDVLDANDQPPSFPDKNLQASVREDAPIGSSVYKAVILDSDMVFDTSMHFFISGGNEKHKFRVVTVTQQSSFYGLVEVIGRLDYETQREFKLRLTISDGKTSDFGFLTIKVTDANDNAPLFSKLVYEVSLREESPAGTSVVTVSAIDIDSPPVQEAITYSIDKRGEQYFRISSSTGEITCGASPLDREKLLYYFFTVYASDGKNQGRAEVMVTLVDINDQAPFFPNPPYYAALFENRAIGTNVTVMQAIDNDDPNAGGNTKIIYSLEDNNGGYVTIDSSSGLVTSIKMVDREALQEDSFKVTVRATDQGQPALSGTTVLQVFFEDENDHKPKFVRQYYYASVSESTRTGVAVTRVEATDEDTGYNGMMNYFIVQGNEPYAFFIEPRTGVVRVSGILDFESKKSYELIVMVSDMGMPQLLADNLAYVFVNITDDNTHPPRFAQKVHEASVREDVPLGYSVLTIKATDIDTVDSFHRFLISSGDEENMFTITESESEKMTAIITVRGKLDRERKSFYNMIVVVNDTSGQSDECIVKITVTDANDNGPHFQPSYFSGFVRENIDSEQFVTTISATDPDMPSNGPPFTFTLINTKQSSQFRIKDSTVTSNTAQVFAYGTFDRELTPFYKLLVNASDSGRPAMWNHTYIYVDVLDVNEHEPIDGNNTIIVNALDGAFAGGVIGRPYYQDDDYNGDINVYKMTSQSPGAYLDMNSATGAITASPGIPLGEYVVKASVIESVPRQDKAPKTVETTTRVVVRNVSTQAVLASTTMRLTDMRKPGLFVQDYYYTVERLLAGIFGVPRDHVVIFGIQQNQTTLPSVDIQLAIRENQGFLSVDTISAKIMNKKTQLTSIGLNVDTVRIDKCSGDRTLSGVCTTVTEPASTFRVVDGDYGQVPAPAESLTIVSMDVTHRASYESLIPEPKNCSSSNPCLNNGICHDIFPSGVLCECEPKFRGPYCQETTRSFKGNSYIWLKTMKAFPGNDFEFEFITKESDGLMLYQGPLTDLPAWVPRDFLAVMLTSGYVTVSISLGSTPVSLNMTRGPTLNDGEWHHLKIIRVRQVGGVSNTELSYPSLVYTGFVGCIRNLVDFGDMYDLDKPLVQEVTVTIDNCENAPITVKEDGSMIEDRSDCQITGTTVGTDLVLNGVWPLQVGGVSNTELSYPSLVYTGFVGCIRNLVDFGDMYDLDKPLVQVNSAKGCELAMRCPPCGSDSYCEPQINRASYCVCNLGKTGFECKDCILGRRRRRHALYTDQSHSRTRRDLVSSRRLIKGGYSSNIDLRIKLNENTNKSQCIFLAVNSLGTEFSYVDVKDRIVRYAFRIGNHLKIIRIPNSQLNTSMHHNIYVRRKGNKASLQLDFAGKATGSSGGSSQLMNLDGGAIFSGGLPRVTALEIVQAVVDADGKAIIHFPDGKVLSSAGARSLQRGVTLISIAVNGTIQVKKDYRKEILHKYRQSVRAIFSKQHRRVLIGNVGSSQAVWHRNRTLLSSRRWSNGSAFGSSSSSSSSSGTRSEFGGSEFSNSSHQSVRRGQYGDDLKRNIERIVVSQGPNSTKAKSDFEGCVSDHRYNGYHMDKDRTVDRYQWRVIKGCPCEPGGCFNNGTCMANATIPTCKCQPGYTGLTCKFKPFNPPQDTDPETEPWNFMPLILLLLGLLSLALFLACKRRPEEAKPLPAHATIREYQDPEADNIDTNSYDIRKLMKYSYKPLGGDGVKPEDFADKVMPQPKPEGANDRVMPLPKPPGEAVDEVDIGVGVHGGLTGDDKRGASGVGSSVFLNGGLIHITRGTGTPGRQVPDDGMVIVTEGDGGSGVDMREEMGNSENIRYYTDRDLGGQDTAAFNIYKLMKYRVTPKTDLTTVHVSHKENAGKSNLGFQGSTDNLSGPFTEIDARFQSLTTDPSSQSDAAEPRGILKKQMNDKTGESGMTGGNPEVQIEPTRIYTRRTLSSDHENPRSSGEITRPVASSIHIRTLGRQKSERIQPVQIRPLGTSNPGLEDDHRPVPVTGHVINAGPSRAQHVFLRRQPSGSSRDELIVYRDEGLDSDLDDLEDLGGGDSAESHDDISYFLDTIPEDVRHRFRHVEDLMDKNDKTPR
ncbi:predicted protein [Nematostella vectensis]|uniref:Protocadherin Fat 4 n=1 Tax=Nematostella vectensis TaxID=45351 RepID=A7RI52_NEMVE|nr:predicted protein [Nematostella vectensis]|eukprot:XP_001641031.1 predicted protein [Nematostella vectensis]